MAAVQAAAHKVVLNPREVAAEYGIPVNTLRLYRHHRKGPKYLKYGTTHNSPVRYRRADIEAWLETQVIDPEAAR